MAIARAGASDVCFGGRAARQQLAVHHRLGGQHLVLAGIQALLLQHPLVDQRDDGEHQAADDGGHSGEVKGRVVIPEIIIEVSWGRSITAVIRLILAGQDKVRRMQTVLDAS